MESTGSFPSGQSTWSLAKFSCLTQSPEQLTPRWTHRYENTLVAVIDMVKLPIGRNEFTTQRYLRILCGAERLENINLDHLLSAQDHRMGRLLDSLFSHPRFAFSYGSAADQKRTLQMKFNSSPDSQSFMAKVAAAGFPIKAGVMRGVSSAGSSQSRLRPISHQGTQSSVGPSQLNFPSSQMQCSQKESYSSDFSQPLPVSSQTEYSSKETHASSNLSQPFCSAVSVPPSRSNSGTPTQTFSSGMPRKIFSKESLGVTDQLPRRPIQSGSTNGSRQTAGKPTDETNYEDLQRPHNYSEMRNRYFPSRPATGEFGTRFNTYFNPPAPRDIYESSTKLNRQGPEIPHGPDQTLAQTEEIPFSGKNMLDAEKHVETRTQGKFSDSSSRGLNGYAARNTQGSSQAALEPRESPRSERFTRAVGHGDVVTQCHASGIMLSPERSMTSSQSSPLIYPMQLEDNRNVHVPSLWSQQPTLSPQHSLQADSRALVAAPLNRRPVSRRRIPEKRPPTRISTRVAERSALQRGFEQGRALAQVSPNTAAMSGPSQSKKRKAESCIEEINRPPRKSSIQYPGMRDSAERLELEQSKSSTSSKSHSKKTKAPCVETSEPCQRIQAAESTIRPVPEPPKRSTNGKFVTKKSEDRRRPKTAAGTATAPEETQAQIPSDQHRPTTAAGTATVPHESTIGSESMAAAPISSGTPRSTIVTLKVPSIALESIANPTATPTSSARISPLSTLLTPTNDKILDLVNAQLKEVLSPVLSALQQVVDRL